MGNYESNAVTQIFIIRKGFKKGTEAGIVGRFVEIFCPDGCAVADERGILAFREMNTIRADIGVTDTGECMVEVVVIIFFDEGKKFRGIVRIIDLGKKFVETDFCLSVVGLTCSFGDGSDIVGCGRFTEELAICGRFFEGSYNFVDDLQNRTVGFGKRFDEIKIILRSFGFTLTVITEIVRESIGNKGDMSMTFGVRHSAKEEDGRAVTLSDEGLKFVFHKNIIA